MSAEALGYNALFEEWDELKVQSRGVEMVTDKDD